MTLAAFCFPLLSFSVGGDGDIHRMEKITTGVSYTTSAVGTGYWLLQLLDK
ncbi:holin [Escherichia coli]|nr:holin [Escherichia coli]